MEQSKFGKTTDTNTNSFTAITRQKYDENVTYS